MAMLAKITPHRRNPMLYRPQKQAWVKLRWGSPIKAAVRQSNMTALSREAALFFLPAFQVVRAISPAAPSDVDMVTALQRDIALTRPPYRGNPCCSCARGYKARSRPPVCNVEETSNNQKYDENKQKTPYCLLFILFIYKLCLRDVVALKSPGYCKYRHKRGKGRGVGGGQLKTKAKA